jgi:hypothetical protein
MPILEVEVVGVPEAPGGLAGVLADEAARALASPGRTWVRLRVLPEDRYAEDGGGPPAGVRPVFVRVLRAELPARETLESEALLLAEAVARACRRPVENVHVLYEPPARGRVAFGGKLSS